MADLRSYKTAFDVLGYTISGGLAVVGAVAKWRKRKNKKDPSFLSMLSGGDDSREVIDLRERVITNEKRLDQIHADIQNSTAAQIQMHRENQARQDESGKRLDDFSRRLDELAQRSEKTSRQVLKRIQMLFSRLDGNEKPEQP